MQNFNLLHQDLAHKLHHHSEIYATNPLALNVQIIQPVLAAMGWQLSDPHTVDRLNG